MPQRHLHLLLLLREVTGVRAYRVVLRDGFGTEFRRLLVCPDAGTASSDTVHLMVILMAGVEKFEDVTDSRESAIREAKERAKKWRNLQGRMAILQAA